MVSPLGGDVGSTWTRLLDGQSGAKPITAFKADDLATKIAATVRLLGLSRFDMKYSSGPLPHQHLMRSIELYGTKVMPLVRDMLS